MSFAAMQSALIEATVALIEIENSVMKTDDDALLQKLDVVWGEAMTRLGRLMSMMGVRDVPRDAATQEIERRAEERRRVIADKKARRERDARIAQALLAA